MISNTPIQIPYPSDNGFFTADITRILNTAFLINITIRDSEGMEETLTNLNEVIQGFISYKLHATTAENLEQASNDIIFALNRIDLIHQLLAACCVIQNSFVFTRHAFQATINPRVV